MSRPGALATFFALVMAASSLLHGAIIALGLEFSLSFVGPTLYLYLLGLAAPALIAIVLQPTGARLSFLRASLLTPLRRTTLTAALLAQPAIILLAWAMTAASGHHATPQLSLGHDFGLVAAGQIWVALGEELGWRGFALPRLLEIMNARLATFTLALIWGVWHVPMFFVAGSLQAQGSPWVFTASILAWSALHTAFYVRERPALGANLAFHACANIMLNVGITDERLTPYLIVAYAFCGVAALWLLHRQAPGRH